MNFKDIKLIVWDLDETLWKGVLSDGEVILPNENRQLLFDLVDRGIVNSICSKNDEEKVNAELKKLGVFDLFVFNSVNWSPKGQRVKQIVEEMGLRFPNVMFIDDNSSNRAEVLNICNGITVESENIIPELIEYYSHVEPKDLSHSRLNQYKVLEKKRDFRAQFGSNMDFLKSSHIKVSIQSDCEDHIDRIHDLIQRSNQLNFTKVRSSLDEIEEIISNDDYFCGYVTVKDDFGEYGIVGFYALDKVHNKLIHFVFSCRTLGMGVEQYVYRELGSPKLQIVGEVSSDVNIPDPIWINDSTNNDNSIDKKKIDNVKIVIKGPCDMQILFGYIAENKNISTEFVYVNDRGVSIEGVNHTSQIVESIKLSDSQKRFFGNLYSFCDDNMFSTKIFSPETNVVVLSMFTDPHLGLYQHKESGVMLAFGEYTNDLTDQSKWDQYIKKELFVANCNFTERELERIHNELEFVGRLSPQQVIENIDFIYKHLSDSTLLILVLGSETPYKANKKEAYIGREKYHSEVNRSLKNWAADKKRVQFIDVNNYISDQDAFTDNINHFQRSVYYKMSNDLVNIIMQHTGKQLKTNGEFIAKLTALSQKIKKAPKKIKGLMHIK